ncbi:ABC transporter permease [Chryseobacterium nematophagum]|uniref:ABC transporter permease n=1 Tax=Chryseobacterium nematophagum TaxID=2305228 RepID=A0A3M7LEJ7_9FLAO|nr:ABC transporter permease [Chryseobacterium nematophagum]RMZ60535.1 ABC transporter permease [Chryseobacterium nematophagum]
MEIREGSIIDIRNFLPHREPMLMVDSILELTTEKVTTTFKILEKNIFVHNNELAEVGLIENLAQTCSSITGQNFFKDPNIEVQIIGFITNIKKIEILSLPKVGNTIISQATLLSQFENICNILCEASSNNKLLIKAEITLFIQELKY